MLEGTIGEFSLPDIFQLIALTKKSGALRVSATQTSGRIIFKEGEVCFAAADVTRMAIGARLVRSGLATEDHIIQVLEQHRSAGVSGSLSQALLAGAGIDEGALDAFLRASIEDAVFELMRVREGTFTFDAAHEPDVTIDLSVSTEHLVAEGTRRMGEWSSIRAHIPSDDAVLSVSPAAAGDGQVALSAEQWEVLALIDGARTVRDIVDLSRHGEFTTVRLLSGMVTQGLVEVTGVDGAGALEALVARRDLLRRIESLELGEAASRAPARARPRIQPEAVVSATPRPAVEAVEDVGDGAAVAARPSPVDHHVPAEDATPLPVVAERVDLVATRSPAPSAQDEGGPLPSVPAAATSLGGEASGAAESGRDGRPATPLAEAAAQPRDRVQMARELAALGIDGEAAAPAPTKPLAAPGAASEEIRRLTRDEDVNKGLLLRLIDGVKGA